MVFGDLVEHVDGGCFFPLVWEVAALFECGFDFDEGRGKGSDPAHFEGLEREGDVSFMDVAQVSIEGGMEGCEGDSIRVPDDGVDGGVCGGASGAVDDGVGKRNEDIMKDCGAGCAVGVLTGCFKCFVKARVKHGV